VCVGGRAKERRGDGRMATPILLTYQQSSSARSQRWLSVMLVAGSYSPYVPSYHSPPSPIVASPSRSPYSNHLIATMSHPPVITHTGEKSQSVPCVPYYSQRILPLPPQRKRLLNLRKGVTITPYLLCPCDMVEGCQLE